MLRLALVVQIKFPPLVYCDLDTSIPLRKRLFAEGAPAISFLFAGAAPANSLLFAGGAPANSFLFAGGTPANSFLFAGGAPANNLFHRLIDFKYENVSKCKESKQ